MKNKAISIIFAVILVAGFTASIEPGQQDSVQDMPNVEQGEIREPGLLSSLGGLLAVTSGQDVYRPGDTAEFDVEVDIQESFESEGKVKVVEFYDCYDSGCDDPDRDEAIGADGNTIPFSDTIEPTTWSWNVEWQVPQEEGYYAAVAYIHDPDTNEVYTDSPEKIFEVQSEESPEPDIVASTSPNVEVENNDVTGTVTLENQGDGDMTESHILEMQPRPDGSSPLSIGLLSTISEQDVCDTDHPENKYIEFQLNAGESRTVEIESQDLDSGTYDVFFLSRDSCSSGNERVQPFPYSEQVSDVEVGNTEDPEVVEAEPAEVNVDGQKVNGQVTFRNDGGPMEETHIVEMQVRPAGTNPLSIAGEQRTCDSSHPENVYQEFQLDAGEEKTYNFTSNAPNTDQRYDVYFLTRSQCGNADGTQERVSPYENSEKISNRCVGECGETGNPIIVILLAGAGITTLLAGGIYLYG